MSGITSVTLVVSNHSPSICLYRRTRRLHAMRWQPMHGASVVTRCARIKDRGKLSDFLIPLNNSDLALSILSPLSEFCAHTVQLSSMKASLRSPVSISSFIISGKFRMLINLIFTLLFSHRSVFQVARYSSTQLDEKDRHQETETCTCCWRSYYWKDD